jgi:hypothetical protein
MDASGRQCVICPMKPVFSDVSHLLTHLLSKGHLSQKNQLEFRQKAGTNNAAATTLLTAYDDWYSANNLDPLLAERQAAKDGRTNKTRSSGQNALIQNTLIPPVLTDPGVVTAAPNSGVAETTTLTTVYNGTSAIRIANGTTNKTPVVAAASTPIATAATTLFATASPAVAVTEAHTVGPTVATPTLPDYIDPRLGEPYGSGHEQLNTEGASSATSTVGWYQAQLMPQDSDVCNAYTPGNTELTSWDGQEDIDNNGETISGAIDPFEVDEKLTNDNARSEASISLKGVQWPGMDLFDAATPEMRRKRNQKKDGTLVKQMEANSQQVEPTEQIFQSTEGLPFQAEREITGKVEDYPPLEGESPIAKKGPVRGKPGMLRERDANVPRARDTKRVKKENPRSRDESEDTLEYTEPARFPNNFGSAYREADGDQRRALQGPRFSVFKDEQDQTHTESAMIQAPQGTLAPAQLALNNTSNISHHHGHRIPPSNENIEPIMSIANRANPPIFNPMSPFVNGNNIGQGYFYNDPIFGQLWVAVPSQLNPIFGATSATTFGHHSYGEEVPLPNSRWTTNSQAMASGAGTIEEDDEDTFTQMHTGTTYQEN